MMVTRPRRTREITGPTPHSVAIIARQPSKVKPDQMILDRRRREDELQTTQELNKKNKECDLRNDWERQTDKRIQQNTVKRRVQNLLQANDSVLEQRRDRLRELLRQEEQHYIGEMSAGEETTIERQAKMRDRARQLREKREEERLAVVQEKLEQQWRNQCEELRSTMSRRQQDMVAAERFEQLKMKSDMDAQKEAEEKMYAQMWYADMEAKAKREEEDTRRAMSANRDMLEVLQTQMAALEAKKEEEKALQEHEAKLLKEQADLRKYEEQRAAEEKRRQQQATRDLYDKSLRLKLEKQAREEQEQLAFDMQMLEELLQETQNEAREQSQRKKELREEDRRYRDYLHTMREDTKRHEAELERLVDSEVEKTWQKQLSQWRLEREARQKLLQDVLEARRIQVHEKLVENEKKLDEAKHDREELVKKIEENKRLETAARDRELAKAQAHQNDLLGQINYNERQLHLQQRQEEHQWDAQMQAEVEYQRKLSEALSSAKIEKMHPMRRNMSGTDPAARARQGLSVIT